MPEANGQTDLRERPMGELLKQLADDTGTLVRKEIELAKAEMSQKGQQLGKGAGMFGGAGVAGLLALGALTAAAILALDAYVASWLAALLVGAVWAAVAGALALAGKEKVTEATPPVPEQTIETVKEDVEWAKTQAASAKR